MTLVIIGATGRAKLQQNRHHQHTNIHLFTGKMSFPSPDKQCYSIEGKKYHI